MIKKISFQNSKKEKIDGILKQKQKTNKLTKKWDKNLAQDNSHWGQFLDRNGNIKQDLAEKLIKNAHDQYSSNINDYFPLPALISEVDLLYFYTFYKLI